MVVRLTGGRWRNKDTVPGLLVIATNSPLAARTVEFFLHRRDGAGLFGIIKHHAAFDDANDHESADDPIVLDAWEAAVHPGMERSVLFDLEHFVAQMLEGAGGYDGIDPHLSIDIARRSISANQARGVSPTMYMTPATMPSSKVHFNEPVHDRYVAMMTQAIYPRPMTRSITVAMLDSAVHPPDLADRVEASIERGFLTPSQITFPALAHGAVTASIVGRLAPNARIVVYPVFADEVDRPS